MLIDSGRWTDPAESMEILRPSLESSILGRKNTFRWPYLSGSLSQVPNLTCLIPSTLPGGDMTRSPRGTPYSLLERPHTRLAAGISMIPTCELSGPLGFDPCRDPGKPPCWLSCDPFIWVVERIHCNWMVGPQGGTLGRRGLVGGLHVIWVYVSKRHCQTPDLFFVFPLSNPHTGSPIRKCPVAPSATLTRTELIQVPRLLNFLELWTK